MEPSMHNGSLLIVDKRAYLKQHPKRSDIIAFYYPGTPKQTLLKRVIGLPGEKVTIQQGKLMINGILLNESYIVRPYNYEGEWEVGENEYFVLGDNRADSSDSHSWGMLPGENIIGKVIWVYWPAADWGPIPAVDYQP